MDTLWAPWRMQYIVSGQSKECIFCTAPQEKNDSKNKILYRGKLGFIMINIYPYANGHLMVSPYRHLSCITKMDNSEILEIGQLTQKSMEILGSEYQPDGFNVGYNIGTVGGASFDEHIHSHIVPRWKGDTNFMPVIGQTKVLPEHIEATFNRLQPLFEKITLE